MSGFLRAARSTNCSINPQWSLRSPQSRPFSTPGHQSPILPGDPGLKSILKENYIQFLFYKYYLKTAVLEQGMNKINIILNMAEMLTELAFRVAIAALIGIDISLFDVCLELCFSIILKLLSRYSNHFRLFKEIKNHLSCIPARISKFGRSLARGFHCRYSFFGLDHMAANFRFFAIKIPTLL